MSSRRRRTVQWLTVALAAGTLALVACSSSSGGSAAGRPSPSSVGSVAPSAPLSTTYPNSIAVLGHSGTTGANSDPADQGGDARQNSWATGDNPEVDSIYTRLLALNPAIKGHVWNFGVDGTSVDQLADQVAQAVAVTPIPDLFLIQEVDNDMRCDGTDPQNYAPFAQTLADNLRQLVAAAPKATILLVSSPPGTVTNYGAVVRQTPHGVQANTGTGPCDLFDLDGRAVPAHWRYQEQVIRGYQARLAAVCRTFSQCRYDDGALYRMPITADDLAPDALHLSVSGHRKQAALEWAVLGYA